MQIHDEDEQLRSAALQNASSILAARRRAEDELIRAKEALERKTEELARSLASMRATLESTADGILVTDDAGRATEFNDNYLRMWGVPPELLEHRDHRALLDWVSRLFEHPEQFRARVEEIYATAPPETFDVLELADGRVFERSTRVQVVGGRQVGRVWNFRDVTGYRRTAEALRDETRVLELLNRTGIALASQLDLQALLQAATDFGTELSGAEFGAFFYNEVGLDGETYLLYTLSGASRESFDSFGKPRATPLFGPTFRGESPIRCDDVTQDPRYGRMAPHHGMPAGHLPVRSYLAVPVISRGGGVIGGMFFGHSRPAVFTERAERIIVGVAAQAAVAVDNARLFEAAQKAAGERKELLDRERAARAEAERIGAIKDEFLATLSHELRTPLSAILGWSTILRQRRTDEEDLRKGLDAIERNARVQTQLIEDLLDMSRITSGKIRLDIQPISPLVAIEAALDTVRPAAEAKAIRLELMLDPQAGPIMADPSRLQQVIWNLLSNAIKFTPRGGKVQVVLARVNSHIEISVADTGIGIPPEFLPHVFDRFRQAESGTTRAHGGLGLGLSIVKNIVELHGGSIRVASEGANLGTTFTVLFPLSVVRHDGSEERRHPGRTPALASLEVPPTDLAGLKVLVVDDEPDARELLARVLESAGAEVAVAGSGSEALERVRRERPDLGVIDIGMPEMDGYELLRRIRGLGEARGGKMPAVALTAFARTEDRTRALRAGFLVHVAKPVEPAELVATLASLAGRTG